MRPTDAMRVVQSIINDPDMKDLKIDDLKNFMLHLNPYIRHEYDEDDEPISDENLHKYVL